MNQYSILHLAPHTGSVKVQENTPMFLHTFGLRVQLYTRNKVLMTKDPTDTPKLHGLVSIELCTLLARQSANPPSI